MDDQEHGGLVAETRELVEEYIKPQQTTFADPIDGTTAPFVLLPSGPQVINPRDFDGYRTKPRRRCGTAELTSLDSFIFHANRFKSDASAVFANDDRRNPSLTAVLDYHPAGAGSNPDFGRHRTSFKFPLSDEWKAWHESNGSDNAMSMVEFAEFIEDRIVDVEHPDDVNLADDGTKSFVDKLGGNAKIASPTKLLDLSTGLSIFENSVIQQHAKLQSGEGHIEFASEHTDGKGGAVDIPSMFVLAIPVFRNGAFYRVIARLRYRVTGGTVRFWYELWRTDRVFDHAFDEAAQRVNAETVLPVLYGAPE